MLTPVEIQSKTFKGGGLGYDKRDVDMYMKEILKSYEELYRQNVELKDKVSTLTDGIDYYKTMEKTLQKALVLAEKTAEETRQTAQRDAKRIVKEASVNANLMLADARNELEKLHSKTVALCQQYEKYKAQFKNLAAAQIELLESDAFRIEIQNLDAFVSDAAEPDSVFDGKRAAEDKDRSDEVSEIASAEGSDTGDSSAFEDTSDTVEDEYSDEELESQESDDSDGFKFTNMFDSEE